MIIAIDGPAGSGKSTIAALLAKEYNALFLNTGSFYRALTYKLLEDKSVLIDNLSEDEMALFAKNLKIEYRKSGIFVDDVNVNPFLRTDKIEKNVSL